MIPIDCELVKCALIKMSPSDPTYDQYEGEVFFSFFCPVSLNLSPLLQVMIAYISQNNFQQPSLSFLWGHFLLYWTVDSKEKTTNKQQKPLQDYSVEVTVGGEIVSAVHLCAVVTDLGEHQCITALAL